VAFRTVLWHTLAAQPEITVVGEAGDGREAVDLALALSPDVILMDVRMPTLDGVEATREITAALPDARVVALTGHGDRIMAAAMLEAGAISYCVKGTPLWELERAVAEAVLDDPRPALDGRVQRGSDRRPSGVSRGLRGNAGEANGESRPRGCGHDSAPVRGALLARSLLRGGE
jgi:DNA-binding NarL/FixJ family response regulator